MLHPAIFGAKIGYRRGSSLSFTAVTNLRRDGRDVPEVGESASIYAARQTAFSDATDIYHVRQVLRTDTTSPVYRVLLTRFADEASAPAWLPGIRAFASIQGIGDVAEVPDAPRFGEESLVLAFQLTTTGGTQADYLISARVGADVVMIILRAEGAPRLEMVAQLMTHQLACMAEGACSDPSPVPPTLQ